MISIIVPIYNTSRFLGKCIQSILSQSYKDFELILVNDGSQDNSLEICKKYSKTDPRIIIVDKKNEGVDKARFSGINISRGDYITFVDSDDWIEKDTLKVMYENIERYNVDYVEVGSRKVFDKLKLIKKESINPKLGYIKIPELFDNYYISFFGYNIISVSMWGKLYKTAIIKQACLQPSNLKMGEDLYFNMMLFPHLKSIYISDYIGYNYRFGGMTSRYNPSLFPDLKTLYYKKKELISLYSYDKANDFIRYEIVNVFKSDIYQKILFKYGTKDEIIKSIEVEMKDPIWSDLRDVSNKDYLNNPIPKAILSQHPEELYDICVKDVNNSFIKWKMKRIASTLLKYL